MLFNSIYADGITRENIKDAIAEFERSLITPNSRFDRFFKGDANAINVQEKRGYRLFKRYGCVSCHQGVAVGGNMFQIFGVINSYFKHRGNITQADLGRFNVTGNPADKHSFKVPSLRLAALTPPYLHDGNAATLREAVDRGYWCLTVADCCAALDPALHKSALSLIAGEGHLFGWIAESDLIVSQS